MGYDIQKNPVQLWVGEATALHDEAIRFAQTIDALCNGCRVCISCRIIAQRQSPKLIWLTPGPHGHTKESLDEGLAPLQFTIDSAHVLVITSAELLPPAAANRLLKPLEEPPPDWHILLLTDRPTALLATVRSRCIMRIFTTQDSHTVHAHEHPTIAWLTHPTKNDFAAACAAVETLPKTPAETIHLFEEVVAHWHARATRTPEQREPHPQAILPLLIQMGSTPPSPGGTVYFWRLVIISVHQAVFNTNRKE